MNLEQILIKKYIKITVKYNAKNYLIYRKLYKSRKIVIEWFSPWAYKQIILNLKRNIEKISN